MNSYSVAQNTSFFTVASVFQKIISFFYFALVARLIGVENTGVYFFAIAFTTIFSVMADFGLGAILTRQSARFPEQISSFINTVFGAKIFSILFTYLLVVIFANLLGYSDQTRILIYISGLTMIFDNIHNIFYAVFRASKNLAYESFALVASQFITLAIGTTALLLKLPLIFLILAYTIPSLLNAFYSAFFAIKKYSIKFRPRIDKKILKSFLKMGLPFAIAGIIARFYAYSDSIIMSKLLSNTELGLWGVSYKFATAFQFIPIALATSAYPVFSSFFINNKLGIRPLFEKAYRYLFFVSFPIIGGIIVVAQPVISLLYGPAYTQSVLVLQVLVFAMAFIFVTFINGALLNAIDKQKVQTVLIGIALLLSVVFNLILIPQYKIMGAAIVVVITNIFLASTGFVLCRKYIKISFIKIFKYFNQTFWPALVMSVVAFYLLQNNLHLVLVILVGMLVYFILVFATGALNKEILKKIKSRLIR